jgi:hypothetical protein
MSPPSACVFAHRSPSVDLTPFRLSPSCLALAIRCLHSEGLHSDTIVHVSVFDEALGADARNGDGKCLVGETSFLPLKELLKQNLACDNTRDWFPLHNPIDKTAVTGFIELRIQFTTPEQKNGLQLRETIIVRTQHTHTHTLSLSANPPTRTDATGDTPALPVCLRVCAVRAD